MVGPGSESQAQSLVGADRTFRVGLSLRDFVDCKSDMPGLFQRVFLRYGLGMSIIELTLRVNMQPAASLVVLVAGRGVAVEFVKENLRFNGDDSPMAILLLSLLGAVAEFERSLILERQREGIALAKVAGKYKGRSRSLTTEKVAELLARAAAGERKTQIAKSFGISRETLYSYLRTGLPEGTSGRLAA